MEENTPLHPPSRSENPGYACGASEACAAVNFSCQVQRSTADFTEVWSLLWGSPQHIFLPISHPYFFQFLRCGTHTQTNRH